MPCLKTEDTVSALRLRMLVPCLTTRLRMVFSDKTEDDPVSALLKQPGCGYCWCPA